MIGYISSSYGFYMATVVGTAYLGVKMEQILELSREDFMQPFP